MEYRGPLGAELPAEKPYADKWPLTAEIRSEIVTPKPVVLAIPWYSDFDRPEQDASGKWWICKGKTQPTGFIRGGHAICIKPSPLRDYEGWWLFYNQGNVGACVGFAVCRHQSLYNRTRYDAFWHYYEAQKNDEFAGENYEGTTANAGFWVAKNEGMVWVPSGTPMGQEPKTVKPAAGISAYRWLFTVDEIRDVLKSPHHDQFQAVQLLQSWGAGYPRIVYMPYAILGFVLQQDGEAVTATDR